MKNKNLIDTPFFLAYSAAHRGKTPIATTQESR